jgi:hypothetical protein
MRLVAVAVLVIFAAVVTWGWKAGAGAQAQSSQGVVAREPVIVELFTSEGCSSCPPADALLAELQNRQPLGNAEIIALEEHVTYWDELGWKDPFSSSAWTTRQSDYASALHNGNPYTPEMVVDGTAGFVGSRESLARQEIEKAAGTRKAKVEISEVSPMQNNSVALKIIVEKPVSAAPKDTEEVVLAITESGLHSSVKGGENVGKELQHSPVLRELKVIGVIGKNGQEGFSAQPDVKLDSKWNAGNLRPIVFVQERKSRRILAAAVLHLT